jgi:hypothetical protein
MIKIIIGLVFIALVALFWRLAPSEQSVSNSVSLKFEKKEE